MQFTELQIRGGFKDNSKDNFLLFLNENMCCDHSLELSRRDGSNDGSQHKLHRSSMDNYPLIIPFTPSCTEH